MTWLWTVVKQRSKSIHWKLFVGVILFKNSSYCSYCLIILISLWIKIMKRIWAMNLSITQSKINKYLESNFTSAINVVKEWLFLLNLSSHNFHRVLSIITHHSKFASSINSQLSDLWEIKLAYTCFSMITILLV